MYQYQETVRKLFCNLKVINNRTHPGESMTQEDR